MPLFSYRCDKCKHDFETIVKFDEREKKQECPKCGGKIGKLINKVEKTNYSLNRSYSRMRHGK